MPISFTVNVTKPAFRHIEACRRYDRNRILDGIREQLSHNPNQETRNKEMLRENPLSDWELRIPPFPVFHEVNEQAESVRVLAVGIKERNRLTIGGKEM